jgi:YfiH family protein
VRSPLLEGFSWIDHAFGTRDAAWSQEGMASLRQIHSGIALIAERPGCIGEGDALVTNLPGLAVSVKTADCFPILLVNARARVVAAVHAGWRGTAAGVGPAAIETMKADPGDIHAAIGPGIGVCCYHVGEDVARQFGMRQAGPLDLAEVNRRQLIDAGVPERQIEVLRACTCCDAKRFHSYRRDQQQAGRMISYIRMKTAAFETID